MAKSSVKSIVGRLWKLLYLERSSLMSIYFYAILSGIVQLTIPIGIQAIVGFVVGSTMVVSIYVLLFFIVLAVMAVGLMQVNQMRAIEKIQQKIFVRNAYLFTDKLPKLDLVANDNYYLPEKVNRFFDTITVQKGLSKLFLDLPAASIQIFFGIILLSLYHPIFIIFGICLILLLWLMLSLTSRYGIETSIKESNYKYELTAWFQEIARAVQSFKFFDGTDLNINRADRITNNYLEARTDHFKILTIQYKAIVFFKVLITGTMLTAGAYLLVTQEINIGEFIAAEIIILSVIAAVEKLISSLDTVYDVLTGLEKVAVITENEIDEDGKLQLDARDGIEVQIQDLSFGYNDKEMVIHNLSCIIKPNALTVINGPKGTGKSSLLKVLSGAYHKYQGSILLNDLPLQNITRESLRNNIGMFFGRQELIDDTVWNNIAFGRKDFLAQEILELSKEMGIEDFLTGLTDGLETKVDSAGSKLPSTVAKKVLLLRAFANRPRLVLLHDPLAGLSADEQKNLKEFLMKYKSNATIIIANHGTDFNDCWDDQIVLN